jgi:4-diphosphocytidyl-2-C-methyl-D-erythritol kinase
MTGACATAASWAPAKVNLTLRVLGQRGDGYHLIESLMVPVSLCDRVELRVEAGNGAVTCSVDGPEEAPTGDQNLAARAARRIVEELGAAVDIDVRVTKHIPPASGLGGGSSDAAAVLRTLPAMLGRTFRPLRLAEIAVSIGADVPFFLTCRPSVAMGVGEILVPVPRFPEMSLVVAVPNVQVSTKWAYGNALPPMNALTSREAATTTSLRLRLKREPITTLLSNDFQAGVTAAFPEVQRLKGKLESLGAEATVMSGSGSAVVGLFRSSRRAEEAAATVARPDRAYAVRVLRRRPAIGDDGR